mmetsp:Transcript_101172/g.184672  ORF Transcript_101172/g.184672 Transcript_101172/m.184672 type:complete len:158 (-) Transcript_101172:226-699(-)
MGAKPCCAAVEEDSSAPEVVAITQDEVSPAGLEEVTTDRALIEAEPAKEESAKEEPPKEEPKKEEAAAPKGLEFGFLSDSGTKTITFTQKPVGMTFEKKVPIVVCSFKPGSKAKELGVQIGWEMKSIGGVDLTKCEKYEDAIAIILKQCETLPEATV